MFILSLNLIMKFSCLLLLFSCTIHVNMNFKGPSNVYYYSIIVNNVNMVVLHNDTYMVTKTTSNIRSCAICHQVGVDDVANGVAREGLQVLHIALGYCYLPE